VVCFLCQQSAEKNLKAVLCELGNPIPHTHLLLRLLNDLLPHEPSLKTLRRSLDALTKYAVDYRYPAFYATARQMRAALRHMERVRLAARSILGLPP
jgi:HEPN domain-containing protein